MARGLIMRMESEAGEALQGAGTEEQLAITAEAAEGAQEVESASGDVTEVETGIENAIEAGEELNDIEGTLEEAAAEDGVSPREAEHIQARLEHVARLLGTTVPNMGLTMRREAFGGAAARVAATKMRLEGVKEWGKKIWEALKKGWEWLKDAVKNFFTRLTKSADGLVNRLKALQARVNSMAAKKTDTKKSEVSAGAKVFSVEGKTDINTIKLILENVSHTETLMGQCAATLKAEVNGAFKAGSVDLVKDLIVKAKGAKPTSLPKEAPEKAIASLRTSNGKALVVVPKTESAGAKEFESFELKEIEVDDKLADSYKALEMAELKGLCTAALEMAKVLVKYKKDEADLISSIDANIKYCQEQGRISMNKADRANEDKRDDARDEVQLALAGQKVAQSVTKLLVNVVPTLAFKVIYAAADVVDGNLANLEEKDKK